MIRTKFHYDAMGDVLHVERTQDVEPIIERNKALVNGHQAKRPHAGRYSQTYNHVASIPLVVVEKWMKEGIDFFNPDEKDKRKIREYLNGEYSLLKTIPGKI